MTFADVQAFAAGCRFADCRHDREPGCAVRAAVADGVLPLDRLEAWRQLVAEGHRQELRSDARLRAEDDRRNRARSRDLRRAYREGAWRPEP